MGFVEQNAMGKSGSAPEDIQSRQDRSDVTELFIVREAGQVDDDAAVRIPVLAERLRDRARSRRAGLPASCSPLPDR